MAHIQIQDIIEYQTFRQNPGPMLSRAAKRGPLMVVKGRERLIVLEANEYDRLMERLALAELGDTNRNLSKAEPPDLQPTSSTGAGRLDTGTWRAATDPSTLNGRPFSDSRGESGMEEDRTMKT